MFLSYEAKEVIKNMRGKGSIKFIHAKCSDIYRLVYETYKYIANYLYQLCTELLYLLN